MAKEFKISTLRLKELEQELHYLKTTREKEVAEQIKEARSFGDLSENSEYDEAKNEQAKLYGRIAEVENILAHAVIIDESEEAEGRIGLGCTIKVEDIETGDEELYAIVGSQEANPMECRISDDSPFGRAMLGHVVGDIVEVEAPVGTLKYKVRREKLAQLQAEGHDPFQLTKFVCTSNAEEIKAHFDEMEGKPVSIAGRMMSKRGMGKVSFCDLQDKTGRIQLYARKDEMDEED